MASSFDSARLSAIADQVDGYRDHLSEVVNSIQHDDRSDVAAALTEAERMLRHAHRALQRALRAST
jgi:hypothetical protein